MSQIEWIICRTTKQPWCKSKCHHNPPAESSRGLKQTSILTVSAKESQHKRAWHHTLGRAGWSCNNSADKNWGDPTGLRGTKVNRKKSEYSQGKCPALWLFFPHILEKEWERKRKREEKKKKQMKDWFHSAASAAEGGDQWAQVILCTSVTLRL